MSPFCLKHLTLRKIDTLMMRARLLGKFLIVKTMDKPQNLLKSLKIVMGIHWGMINPYFPINFDWKIGICFS